MPIVELNYWAILVSGILAMVIGAVWYSPVLFSKSWMKEVGKSEKDMEQAGKGANAGYAIAMVGNLVMAYIMAHFVDYTASTTALLGLQTAIWAWLGFTAATTAMNYVFEGKSWKLFWINNGLQLVTMSVAAMILASWR